MIHVLANDPSLTHAGIRNACDPEWVNHENVVYERVPVQRFHFVLQARNFLLTCDA